MSSINQQSPTNSSNLFNYLQEPSSVTNPSLPPPILPTQIANNSSLMNTSVHQNSYSFSPFPNFEYPTNQIITSVNNAFSQISNPSTGIRAPSNNVSYSHLPQSSAFYSSVHFTTPLDPYASTSSQPRIDQTNVQQLSNNFSQSSSSQSLAPHYQPPTSLSSQYVTNTERQGQGHPNPFDHSSSYSNPNQTGVQPSGSSNSSHSHIPQLSAFNSSANSAPSHSHGITSSQPSINQTIAQESNSSFSHSHTPQSLAPYYLPTAATSQYATNTEPQDQGHPNPFDHSSCYSTLNQTGVQPSQSNSSYSHTLQSLAPNYQPNYHLPTATASQYARNTRSQSQSYRNLFSRNSSYSTPNQRIAQESNNSFSHSHTPQSLAPHYQPPTSLSSQYITNTRPQSQGYRNPFDHSSSYSTPNQTGVQPSQSNSSYSHTPQSLAPHYQPPTVAASQYATNTEPQDQGHPNPFDHSSSYSNTNQTGAQPLGSNSSHSHIPQLSAFNSSANSTPSHSHAITSSQPNINQTIAQESNSSFSHPQIAASNHQTSFTPDLHTQSVPQLNNTMNMSHSSEAAIPSAQSLNNNPSFPVLGSEPFLTPGFMSSRPSNNINLSNRLQSAPNSYLQSSESQYSPNSPLTIDQGLSSSPRQQLQNPDDSLNVDKNKSASTSYAPIRHKSAISRHNSNPSGTLPNTFHIKTNEKNNTANTITQDTVVSPTVAQATTNIKNHKRHTNIRHTNTLNERINTIDSESLFGIPEDDLKTYIKNKGPKLRMAGHKIKVLIKSLKILHIFATDVSDMIKASTYKNNIIDDINNCLLLRRGRIRYTGSIIEEFVNKNPPLHNLLNKLIPMDRYGWKAAFMLTLAKANNFIKKHGKDCGLTMKSLEKYWE